MITLCVCRMDISYFAGGAPMYPKMYQKVSGNNYE